jgi:hypothetical protein
MPGFFIVRPPRGRLAAYFFLRYESWQALQLAPTSPNAARSLSRSPASAAADSLTMLSWKACCFCLKPAASLQTSGRASPPSVPAPNHRRHAAEVRGHQRQRRLAVLDRVLGLGELGGRRRRQQRPNGHTGQRGKRGQLLHCYLP